MPTPRCITGRIPSPAITGRPAPAPAAAAEDPQASTGKTEAAEKETGAKPQGPLIIAISIDQQKVRVYDANGFFAESPVSTGMKGHPTPMGVFSIIQKHKLHHSNIYSGAPMPFMQRITWSGVAMHAGVLPGYPASHGCIRMPMAFAVKMWNWTKMGARVIVTPGEMTPANFSHPLLVAQKVVPQPVIADEPKTGRAGGEIRQGRGRRRRDQADEPGSKPRTAIDRRPCDAARDKPAPRMPAARCRQPIARSRCPMPGPRRRPASRRDASASRRREPNREKPEAATADESQETAAADDAPANTEAGKTENRRDAGEAEERSSRNGSGRNRAGQDEAQSSRTQSLEAKADAQGSRTKLVTRSRRNQGDRNSPPKSPHRAATPAAASPRCEEGSVAPARRREGAPQSPNRRSAGQIAVFVSRKDGKLYVRQNFAPLFDVPVTIAPERPAAGHPCVHRGSRQERSQPAALVGGLAAGDRPQRAAERR